MWLLSFLPSGFLLFIINTVLVCGVIGTILGFIGSRLLFISNYANIIKYVSIALLCVGIYWKGRRRSTPPTLSSKISSNHPLIVIKRPAFISAFKVVFPGTFSAVEPNTARRRHRRCSRIREAEVPDAICSSAGAIKR